MKKISRRTVLTGGFFAYAVAVAGLLASAGPAAAKVSARAAGYRNSPSGNKNCANCRLFNANDRTCQMVAGTFSPNGWCRFWR